MPVFLAEHFRNQFFPAVTALGHRRIGIGFLQRAHLWILLQQRVIGTGRRGKEITARTGLAGGLDHVGVDENRTEAFDAEALDEAHAAHVGGEVAKLPLHLRKRDDSWPRGSRSGRVFARREVMQIPFIKRLLVHRADVRETFFVK